MSLNYVIIVDDGGELKPIQALEFEEHINRDMVEDVLNKILDARAIAAGEYDPSQNDVPIEVMIGDALPDAG
jgi:hypothetical protein